MADDGQSRVHPRPGCWRSRGPSGSSIQSQARADVRRSSRTRPASHASWIPEPPELKASPGHRWCSARQVREGGTEGKRPRNVDMRTPCQEDRRPPDNCEKGWRRGDRHPFCLSAAFLRAVRSAADADGSIRRSTRRSQGQASSRFHQRWSGHRRWRSHPLR